MEVHQYFRPKNETEGIEAAVGSCNTFDRDTRNRLETPLFAKAIYNTLPDSVKPGAKVLDYGCGFGRIAKALRDIAPDLVIYGTDASPEALRLAASRVAEPSLFMLPEDIDTETDWKYDLVYSVYVLQHIPALYLREALQRIHYHLKDGGKFVVCTSMYRLAMGPDGFHDDRRLNYVDMKKEIERFFVIENDLFSPEDLRVHDILEAMIHGRGPGGLDHPAWICRKRAIAGPLFDAIPAASAVPQEAKTANPRVNTPAPAPAARQEAIILKNRLSPGDILVMTAAIRSLKKAHGERFLIGVESPVPEIFANNPHITREMPANARVIDMQYPEVHRSGASGRHFSDGHRKFLETELGVTIPRTGLTPEIFLDQNERDWPSPVVEATGELTRYWVLNAGSKKDYPLKQYHRWQEVVDLAGSHGIKVVQIGDPAHSHPKLSGAIDMIGKTQSHRKLFRTIYKADGVLSCVSYAMHIAAAFLKPAVIVAGGREGTRWELYPNHRFLYQNGALPCCSYDGCWKSKLEDCVFPVTTIVPSEEKLGPGEKGRFVKAPKCLEMTKPRQIVDAMLSYYEGGMIPALVQEEVAA